MVLHLCQVSSVKMHGIHVFPILLKASLASAALTITVGPLCAVNTVRFLHHQLTNLFDLCSRYDMLNMSTKIDPLC